MGELVQQIFSDIVGFIVAYPSLPICAFAVVVLVIVFLRRKKKKSRAAIIAEMINDMNARPEAYAPKPYVPNLPLPDVDDRQYVQQLGLAEFSAEDGIKIHEEGVAQNDLRMALIGLRLFTQYAVEGGYKAYTSPSSEYRSVSDGYLLLARKYNSREYLTLAYSALVSAFVNLYSEPSTSGLEKKISEDLEVLKQELAAHPDS